ncbi:MAG: MFS transporter [bacterium]|nr:MFS transporter [bacterium]
MRPLPATAVPPPVAAPAAPAEPATVPTATRRRTIVAGIAGNVMEWYDFAVYGYFAPTIGAHFFPADSQVASLLSAFGVFAAGFLMRPFGGMVFGHVGDRFGRKTALLVSVAAMAVPTFLIGVLPDHAQIGIAASVLMVALRLVQGLAVGGEYTSSVVYLAEGAPAARRGYMASWSVFGAVAGILLGSAAGALVTSLLSPAAMHAWGWRVPFLLGISVGFAGVVIRRHLTETAPPAVAGSTSPVVEALRAHWPAMLRVAGFNVLNGVAFYLLFVYGATWLTEVVQLDAGRALQINTISMVVLLVLIPLAGALSDRIGRKPPLVAACALLFVLAWPLFWLMHHPDPQLALAGQVAFALPIALFLGVGPVAMTELFPARVRCSAVSIGYNLALAIFGGTTPLVATWLIHATGDPLAIAWYLMAAAAVSLGVILGLRETKGLELG